MLSQAIVPLLLTLKVASLATLLALAHPAAAQNISSASIDGVVTDATGGALPGVTVTITSPALQVSQLVQTTDGQGHYRFIDLPRGTYQLRFEIQGFDPLVRPGLEVNAGFAFMRCRAAARSKDRGEMQRGRGHPRPSSHDPTIVRRSSTGIGVNRNGKTIVSTA